MARLRAGRDDHADRLNLDRPLRGIDFDAISIAEGAGQPGMPFEPIDLVLAKQELDALGHLRDDAVLAGLHPGDIDLCTGNLDAMHIEM